MNQRLGVVGIGFGQILVLLQRVVELIVVEQRLRQRIHGLQIAGLHILRALIRRDRVLGLLHLVVQRAQRELHLRRAPIHGNRLNRLRRMLQIAALGVEPRQVQHHVFGFGFDRLGRLELRFRFFGLVLDGVKLPQHHVIFHALRLQGHNLLELRNRLVQHLVLRIALRVAGRRGSSARLFALAQLAKVNPAQQFVRVNVVGRALQQRPRRHLGIVHAAHAEIEIGEIVGQFRRIGIGVERQLVLLDSLVHLVGAAVGDGVILIHASQRQVKVRLRAVRPGSGRSRARRCRAGIGRWRLRGRSLCRCGRSGCVGRLRRPHLRRGCRGAAGRSVLRANGRCRQ